MILWCAIIILVVLVVILAIALVRAWSRRIPFYLVYGIACALIGPQFGSVKFEAGEWTVKLGLEGVGVAAVGVALAAIAGIIVLEFIGFRRSAPTPARVVAQIRRALAPGVGKSKAQLARELGLTPADIDDCLDQLNLWTQTKPTGNLP